MLKGTLAAEVLPVGILDPGGHHVFIAQIVLILHITAVRLKVEQNQLVGRWL
jgi:hypothetical protein